MKDNNDLEMLEMQVITKLVSDAARAYQKGDLEYFRSCVFSLEELTGISRDKIDKALKIELNARYGLSKFSNNTKGENHEV